MAERILTTTVANLNTTDNIANTDVFLLSQKQSDNSYVSKKIEYSVLNDILADYVINKIPYATKTIPGKIVVGNGLKVDSLGETSIDSSTLPIASNTSLGAIRTNFDKTNNDFPISVDIDTGIAHVNVPDVSEISSGLMTIELFNKLNGIEKNANNYKLPKATSTDLGGIKVGANLAIASDGTLSARPQYLLPTASTTLLGGIKVGTNLAISNGILSANIPVATSDVLGGIKLGYDETGGNQFAVKIVTDKSSESQYKAYVEVPTFSSDTANFCVVLKPLSSETDKYLKGDGTWQTPTFVRSVNGIGPDPDGNINLGYNENELFKFKRVNAFTALSAEEIRSGICYYTIGNSVEGKPLVYIDLMCIAADIWSFITPTLHTVTLDPGEYNVVAVGGGGAAATYAAWFNSGGSGACFTGWLNLTAKTDLSITVGNTAENTTISAAAAEILKVACGTNAYASYFTNYGGKGGLDSDCVISSAVMTVTAISSGFNGASAPYSYVSGGKYANDAYPYGGGLGAGGTSYPPYTGYVKIVKV